MWIYNHPGIQNDSLQHFGVMGMHWGKRKASAGARAAGSEAAKNAAAKIQSKANLKGVKASSKAYSKTVKKVGRQEANAGEQSKWDSASVKGSAANKKAKRNIAIGIAAVAAVATVSIVVAKSNGRIPKGQNFVKNLEFNKARGKVSAAKSVLSKKPVSAMQKNLEFNKARGKVSAAKSVLSKKPVSAMQKNLDFNKEKYEDIIKRLDSFRV